jgi:hypothetical protein
MNGIVKVTLLNDYVPSAGDEFTLWTVSHPTLTPKFNGTPTFDLPKLPAGLAWDTTGTTGIKGVLRVIEVEIPAIKGDVNGDGKVDVEDIVGIVNKILGDPAEGFIEANADVNEDGKIDVDDVVGTVNIILNSNTELNAPKLIKYMILHGFTFFGKQAAIKP